MIKKIIRWALALLLSGVFLYTLYFLFSKSKEVPVVFQTTMPFDTSIVKKTVATGSIVPRKEINVKSNVSGIIEKLFVVAGQQIQAGEVVAKVKIIPNMINLANAENRLNIARINFENAKADFSRNEELFKRDVIAKAELLPVELRYKSAAEEVKAAEDNLQLIKEGVTKSMGNATNTFVKATISGMVLDVPVKEGSQVIESNTFNEGTTISVIANMGEMIFEGKLDESEVGKVRTGMQLILTVGAIENEHFVAELEYISPKGQSENGAIQFTIRARVKEMPQSGFLRAGYSASADIILDKKEKVLAIPESVIQFEKGKAYVEVETAPGKFEKRFIKTGLSDGINIEILEGVKREDKLKMPLIQLDNKN